MILGVAERTFERILCLTNKCVDLELSVSFFRSCLIFTFQQCTYKLRQCTYKLRHFPITKGTLAITQPQAQCRGRMPYRITMAVFQRVLTLNFWSVTVCWHSTNNSKHYLSNGRQTAGTMTSQYQPVAQLLLHRVAALVSLCSSCC